MSAQELSGRIEEHLSRATGAVVRVRAAKPLAGGACQDNVRVDVSATSGELAGDHALVLRADARASLPGSLRREDELLVLEAARKAGVTTPRGRFLAKGLTREGASAYFLDFLEGEAIGRRVVAHPSLEAARAKLPGELVRELALIHAIRPSSTSLPLSSPENPAREALAATRALVEKARVRRPAVLLALALLEERLPEDEEVTLVHGDFRTGNFLVAPSGLVAVLDWEFAHWGSPLEDLAWLCLRDWRFGRLDRAAGGLFKREELVRRYREETGRAVRERDLLFWEILGNVRWAAGSILQGERFLAGENDLELLAIARRSGEMELEALRLLGKA